MGSPFVSDEIGEVPKGLGSRRSLEPEGQRVLTFEPPSDDGRTEGF